jgi:hypothetical protein
MGTWKTPNRLVWHTIVCSRCNRVINRVKLPGISRKISYRLCDKCGVPATPQSSPNEPTTGSTLD